MALEHPVARLQWVEQALYLLLAGELPTRCMIDVGAHHGFKQYVLGTKAPIYHIEHGIGSGWTPEGEALLKQRLREAKIPQLSHDEFMDYDVQMARSGKAIMFNGPNWGLADVELPEIDVL